MSLNNRLNKTASKARREAQAYGVDDEDSFIQERGSEYQKLEVIRRAVKDVKERGKQLEQHRKMQGKAYEGVKSKIAQNMKVIDKVNRKQGYRGNPYAAKKTPQSASTMTKRKFKPVPRD